MARHGLPSMPLASVSCAVLPRVAFSVGYGYTAAALLAQGCAAHDNRAPQIGVQHRVEVRVGRLLERGEGEHARIVDEDVEPSERRDRCGTQCSTSATTAIFACIAHALPPAVAISATMRAAPSRSRT